METELLPCPFCGSAASTHQNDLEGSWSVACDTCSAEMPYVGLSEAEGIAAWNTRTLSTPETAQ